MLRRVLSAGFSASRDPSPPPTTPTSTDWFTAGGPNARARPCAGATPAGLAPTPVRYSHDPLVVAMMRSGATQQEAQEEAQWLRQQMQRY
jgi:hypothetical protein